MIYLSLSADYMTPRIVGLGHEAPNDNDLNLPAAFRESLKTWNDQYQPIIRMGTEERLQHGTRLEIDRLDRIGLALSSQLIRHLPPGSKVSYYSEGLLTNRDHMD